MHGRSLAEPFWLLAHFPLGHKSGGGGWGLGERLCLQNSPISQVLSSGKWNALVGRAV